MIITSDVLSKKAIALYEARTAGEIFCVLTDSRAKKIRVFGIKTAADDDAEELYFAPAAIVGFSDAVTLKNRTALKGRFSLAGGLKALPIGGECYSPNGKFLGTLDSIDTVNGEIVSFTAGGVDYPAARLVSFSENVLILSDTDEKYRLSPPKTRVPKVRDDRTVIATVSLPEPVPPASKKSAEPPTSGFPPILPSGEAKVASYPVPAPPETSNPIADEEAATDENNAAATDEPKTVERPPVPKAVALPVKATVSDDKTENRGTIKPIVLRSTEPVPKVPTENYAPPVRSSVTLPLRADVTVTRTPVTGAGSKTGYYFLIGKTMTRTLLGDDGNAIISQGELITAETINKAEGKLVLLALYSK